MSPIPRSPVDLVDVSVRVVLFSWYASSPLFHTDCNVDSVANELIGLVEGTGASVDAEPVTEVDLVVWSRCSNTNWSEGV